MTTGAGSPPRPPARADLLLGAAALIGAAACLGGRFYPDCWSGPLRREHAVLAAWTAAAIAIHRLGLRRAGRRWNARAENIRWILLGAGALFLLRGLLRPTLHGTSDAGWYGTMLSDMIAQTRAGIFPVWTGQSEYQFNGAINPLRLAPAFHYLGALLDTATGRTLGVFALQNLLLLLLGAATIFSAYFSLGALLPGRRWLAAGLAGLFLACPGVLGIVYISDLFLSWTALPWIPLVWFATVRSFRDGGSFRSMVLLGSALGLCWWCHPPIALWMTLLAGLAQGWRVAAGGGCAPAAFRSGAIRTGAGALAFLAIAAYPIGSVLLFPPEAHADTLAFQAASPRTIAYFLGEPEVFPAALLPLSSHGRLLGDFQLGYSLWALLGFVAWQFRRVRRPEARVLLAFAGLLLLLLAPIPRLDLALWSGVPRLVRDLTGNWVMNRLYLVLAGAIVYGLAAAGADGLLAEGRPRRVLGAIIALGCAWSAVEAVKFSRGSEAGARPPATAVDLTHLENVGLTRFSYLVFAQLPAYFSHGIVDPALENRLWRENSGELLASNLAAAAAGASPRARLEFKAVPKPENYLATTAFRLEPGRRYLLVFDFSHPDRARGVLQIAGEGLYREYGLPEYGGPESFGAGGRHPALLPVWSSRPTGEKALVRFIPDASLGSAASLPPWKATLLEYDPASLPVRVFSWMPYRAHVSSPEPAWLETPRMFQRGYLAWAGGRPAEVRKSAEGLVAIRVPAGNSEVKLKYYPPIGLEILFWVSLAAMPVCLGGLARAFMKYSR